MLICLVHDRVSLMIYYEPFIVPQVDDDVRTCVDLE
jgi:hypothetical protein